MILSPWTRARSALANAVKDGDPPERIAELRRDFRAARVLQALRDLEAIDPPLTHEQRAELAAVAMGGRR